MYCQVGQYFTVDFNTGFLQTANKAAVRHAVDARTSVDTLNPQRAELALAVAAVTVRILAGFDNSLFGYTENTRTCTIVTFGLLQNFFFMATTGNYATLNTGS